LSGSGEGLVLAAHRRHARVHLDDGYEIDCVQKGRRLGLACGDRVRVTVAPGGGVIEAVLPRTSLFLRADAFQQQAIAANVTQVIAVVAPDIAVDEYLLNRWIIAAELQQCRFALVANKRDLASFDAFRERLRFYEGLGYGVVELAAHENVTPLEPQLAGRHTVLVGQSGMGKSTIVNGLAPGAAARTGTISEALGAGRHTTTVSTLYRLPLLDDAWIVDSPGVKAFGLAHAEPAHIAEAFVEMRPYLGNCRFRDCRHLREPGCAVVTAGERIAPQRIALYQELLLESERAREPSK
jgi:ribosome biogenesis GTPase